MGTDMASVKGFYASPRGRMAARLVREGLAEFWPAASLRGLRVLGVGYPGPYLRGWADQARVRLVLHPARLGVHRWPVTGANAACSAGEVGLPFPDLAFDRIVLVHGLEAAENARRLLRELWRILNDSGRMLVVTPNRHGAWANSENSPFGEGQPYSMAQMETLLAEALFRTERKGTALFMPPFENPVFLRGAKLFERFGRGFLPRFGGVTLCDAVKDVYAMVSRGEPARQRVVLIEPGYCANRQLSLAPRVPIVTRLD